MRFQSENTVFRFVRSSVDGYSLCCDNLVREGCVVPTCSVFKRLVRVRAVYITANAYNLLNEVFV